jgi:glutamate dehydrogenase (NAD(P)+)
MAQLGSDAPPAAKPGILETALHHFEQAAARLKLDPSIRQRLARPKEKVEINISPVLPGGGPINVPVFIVLHNDALGPAKGGTRMTSDVTLDDVTGLAMEMTWKTSLIGVPFGGGKSGIRFDPRSIAPEAKEAIIRSFTRGSLRHIGPEIYVPAPDMGTNEADMAHIRDCIAYSESISITRGCYVTGKPVILGGIVGRREATGKGVVYSIQAMCRHLGLELPSLRAAVQGFGNVGSVAALEIARQGARVVAVADVTGGVARPEGIDVEELDQHVRATGGVAGFRQGREMPGPEIFEVDCDVLIPAAAGSQITGENAERIKARLVAEGANAPATPEGDAILNRRGILVIPDILCNAGGVFVSYLEYTQETQREQMTLEEVEQRLSDRMHRRADDVWQTAHRKGQTLREAAMDMAVSRVVEATLARGLLP